MNKGYKGTTIFSSQVNDGICGKNRVSWRQTGIVNLWSDKAEGEGRGLPLTLTLDCCDGTDEYEGKVKCKLDCAEKGEELRKQREAEKEKIQKVRSALFLAY